MNATATKMTTTGLSVEGLQTGYARRIVLSDIFLPEILPGSLVSVIGSNAAGKSTLLKTLAGLIQPSSGRIILAGEDLGAMSVPERVRRVGYLPQSLPQSTSLVAYEAVSSACRAVRPDLTRSQAEKAVDHVFDTLSLRGLALRRLSEMSGGQRQMIGLAQALVRAPRLLLLDEPTSALDLRWQLAVLQTVRSLIDRDNAIGLVALHDLNLAMRFSDLIVVLGGGRVLAAGPPAQVMTPELLSQAYGIEGRVEHCSRGFPMVIVDAARTAGQTIGVS